MIASLGWYPATRPVWERLWLDIRDRLGFGPAALMWPDDFASHWRDPDLLLAFTCSLPLRMGLARDVHHVGSTVWDLPGLPPGFYASHLVTRKGETRALADLAMAGLAINAPDSQSGWGALSDAGLRGPAIVTGSHAASMSAVAEGTCALAAIDVVTWHMAPHPDLAIRKTTPPTPAPPLVTRLPEHVPALRAALSDAIAAMPQADRARTALTDIVTLPQDAYRTPPCAPPEISKTSGHCNLSGNPA